MGFLNFLLGITFVSIFIQDYKNREVYWFLFPFVAFLCGILFYQNTLSELLINALVLNNLFVLLLILILWLYSKLKLRTAFFKTIGLGDVLLFFAVSCSFSTISFIVIFIAALIFSLGIHLYVTRIAESNTTVPLAGYMSLFFLIVYMFNWVGMLEVVYKI
ncbi:hypothetical protein QVZ41_13605 [Wenyingzhuangia sp. chi5]|uniref:Type IV leader peptidase family protein n=1 Tax=Wenyingzhuangia gilva TaxID=3057677 RepID=A0ABT8VVA0_9FLAO|nr:hypothetical protein [Wenyingzhuangia sp. chi5]MDO3695881.1 hypothetical protein [Wenyingzhuangia sp. chi5]